MRKTYYYFTGLILITLGFACCAVDDSNDPNTNNHLKVGDTVYELSSGSLENYGPGGDYEGFNLDLTLFSKNLSIGIDDDGEERLIGSGEAVYFEIFTSNSTSLDNADYIYHETPLPFPVNTFSYGFYAIGWDSDEDDAEDLVEINSGRLTVEKKGDEYEIYITGKDAKGKDVTGYYKGRLQYYDQTANSEVAKINSVKERRVLRPSDKK